MTTQTPMTAMADFYATAFERSARLWLEQTRAWRGFFPQTYAWPAATIADGVPIAPAPLGLGVPWFETLSVELVEMEDRIGVRAACGDIRIDMMITHSPEAGVDAVDVIEGEALKVGEAR